MSIIGIGVDIVNNNRLTPTNPSHHMWPSIHLLSLSVCHASYATGHEQNT